MIQCRQAAELIPLHVGDDLPRPEATLIEEHLEACALCSAEYESFARARSAILELREEMPARGSLWEGVAKNLAPGAAATQPDPRARFRGRWLAWSSLALAAALALMIVPPFMTQPAGGAKDDTPTVAGPAPLVRATTPEELQEFLLRNGGLQNMSPAQPVSNPDDGNTPLTTPAGVRRYQ